MRTYIHNVHMQTPEQNKQKIKKNIVVFEKYCLIKIIFNLICPLGAMTFEP